MSGVMGLSLLSLDRSPAADQLEAAAEVWVLALQQGRDWSEARDAGRIRAGFMRLAAECTRWPAPRQLLDAMPPPPALAALPPRRAVNTAVAAKRQAEIAELLGGADRFAARNRPGLQPMSEAARELMHRLEDGGE